MLKALNGIDIEESRSALSSNYIVGSICCSSFKKNTDLPFRVQRAKNWRSRLPALSNNISIIEGPPGTGKTQTILNVIANLIVQNKTVAIVSNNNAAVFNVWEKLKKYGYGIVVASLGNNDNRASFFNNLEEQKINQNFEAPGDPSKKSKERSSISRFHINRMLPSTEIKLAIQYGIVRC